MDTSPQPFETDIAVKRYEMEPFAMLILGGAGDLSRRMLMPALYHLFADGELPDTFFIAGAGLPEMTDGEYRDLISAALARADVEADREKLSGFIERLYYVPGDFSKDDTYEDIRTAAAELGSKCGNNIIFYLAVAPTLTEMIVRKLQEHNLCKGTFNTKLMLEKPFGRDRASAVELNEVLTAALDERQIFRIDHYLGKETVQNILFFRFSNIFEELWSNHYIDNVQITVAEQGGIGTRGQFYEQTGVVRDIIQNHMLQLLALVAMEPPALMDPDSIHEEKVKVFRSIETPDADYVDNNCVRGQYGPGLINGNGIKGYRQEDGVRPDSDTPTYFAAKLKIANWRWAGVPFYVRSGKRMAQELTQIIIQFRQPPLRLFSSSCRPLQPNLLTLTVQPREEICLRFGVKYPYSAGRIQPVNLEFSYEDAFNVERHPVYERLLADCMRGDPTLFVRQDAILAMWDVVDPINSRWKQSRPDFPNYEAGSWGPPEAGDLIARDGKEWLSI